MEKKQLITDKLYYPITAFRAYIMLVMWLYKVMPPTTSSEFTFGDWSDLQVTLQGRLNENYLCAVLVFVVFG